MQTFIETGDRKINEIQARFGDLQGIFDKYNIAKNKLELYDDRHVFGDREPLENHSYEFKAKFIDFLHTVIDTLQSRNSSLRSSNSGNKQSHSEVTYE